MALYRASAFLFVLYTSFYPHATVGFAVEIQSMTTRHAKRLIDLGWQPVMAVEHFQIAASTVLAGGKNE
jgi:hypothetical protein